MTERPHSGQIFWQRGKKGWSTLVAFSKELFGCSFPHWSRDWNCMKEDQLRFLSLLGQLPARLTAEQAGWVLNCQPHDIPALIHARLLKPLGNPAQNGAKFFATVDIMELLKDRSWLVKMTNTINQHWRNQNARKKTFASNGALNGHAVGAE